MSYFTGTNFIFTDALRPRFSPSVGTLDVQACHRNQRRVKRCVGRQQMCVKFREISEICEHGLWHTIVFFCGSPSLFFSEKQLWKFKVKPIGSFRGMSGDLIRHPLTNLSGFWNFKAWTLPETPILTWMRSSWVYTSWFFCILHMSPYGSHAV